MLFRSNPVCKTFFASGSSAPLRVEREGGSATWLAGTLAVPGVQGHGLLSLQEFQSVFFPASCSWLSEDLFSQCFYVALLLQALKWLPCLGSSSVV